MAFHGGHFKATDSPPFLLFFLPFSTMQISQLGRALAIGAASAGVAFAGDECAVATAATVGTTPFDTTTATVSPEAFPCGGGTTSAVDLWFTYTPAAAGNVLVFDTFGSSFDTRLQVLDGTCGALVSLACNDDSGGLQSRIQINAPSTNPLFVRVAGFSSATGTGVLNISDTFPGDECAGALALPTGVTAFNTVGASTSAPAFSCGSGGSDIWFAYTAVGIGNTVTVSACGSGYDTVLEAYSGTCGTLTSLVCNDDSCGLQSQLSFVTSALGTYFVRVGGFAGASGTGSLTVTDTPAPPQFDLTFTDVLPGTWIDIAATGTPLNLSDDGEANITTTVGNALFAAGTARVGSNGGVRFGGTGLELSTANAALPAGGAFSLTSQSLLPFWDDLNTVGGTVGNIFWEEVGGVLVVQWNQAGFFGSANAGQFVTFQVQVPSSGPALAQFLYQDIEQPRASGGSSATIGYQAGGAGNNVQHLFNAHFGVKNGTVLSLINKLNTQVVFTDDIAGTFTDISATGAPLNLGDDGEANITTTVGNALVAAGTARVGANGAIRFGGSGLDLGWTNQSLPATGATGGSAFFSGGQVLAPFWDDLLTNTAPSGTNGDVLWQEIGGTLIVQWNNVTFFGQTTSRTTFQVKVFSTGPYPAQFIYSSVDSAAANFGGSATIGYQAGGFAGTTSQYSFNTPVLSNGTVLTLCYTEAAIGSPYCTPVANSTGAPARMYGTGTASLAANNLVLNVDQLPLNSFGFFNRGTATAFTPAAGNGQGTLCVGGTVTRGVGGAIVSSGATGAVSLAANLGSLAGGTPTAGATLWLQYWYRDTVGGTPTSNLSNALQIKVLP